MFEFKCPHCGSEFITCEMEDMYPDEMCCVYECHNDGCEKEWRVVFAITPKEMIL